MILGKDNQLMISSLNPSSLSKLAICSGDNLISYSFELQIFSLEINLKIKD